MSGSQIFISYRRGPSSTPYARGIYERASERFGAERVFMDMDTMEPGVDFVEFIEDALASCAVLIAVIGPDWLDAEDQFGRRRLDNADDFVRTEIAAALARDDVRVIPVLVGDATMFAGTDLPDVLAPLARRNATKLSDDRWPHDMGRLLDVLAKVVDPPAASPPSDEAPAAEVSRTHRPRPVEMKDPPPLRPNVPTAERTAFFAAWKRSKTIPGGASSDDLLFFGRADFSPGPVALRDIRAPEQRLSQRLRDTTRALKGETPPTWLMVFVKGRLGPDRGRNGATLVAYAPHRHDDLARGGHSTRSYEVGLSAFAQAIVLPPPELSVELVQPGGPPARLDFLDADERDDFVKVLAWARVPVSDG